MAKTIEHLVDHYGSVDNYIRETGISDREIAQLGERLRKPGQAPSQSTAVEYHEGHTQPSFEPQH